MLHTRRVAVVAALALAGTVACSCATRGAQLTTSQTQSAPCDGQPYVEVHNTFETAVEVYGYSSGGARQYLGTVAPGTQRISLAEAVGYVYAEVGGRRITGRRAENGVGGPAGVSFIRGCAAHD